MNIAKYLGSSTNSMEQLENWDFQEAAKALASSSLDDLV
jgi:hypothetical protein